MTEATELRKLQCFRFRPELSIAEEEVVVLYLCRTTLFWNYIVQAMDKSARRYISQPQSEASTAAFLDKLAELYKSVVDGNGSDIHARWRTYIPMIRELPRSVLQNRIHDMAESYGTAKAHYGIPRENATKLPKVKTVSSTQSVRFDEDQYTIVDDRVIVKSPFPFDIQLPGLSGKIEEGVKYTFSITKRRSNPEEAIGPVSQNMTYVFTFKQVS